MARQDLHAEQELLTDTFIQSDLQMSQHIDILR